MVGVDQAQIDKILAGASSDDPEARLDTLEKELDFVKTSIKRLLIDLRERMNELDNPFTCAAASYGGNRLAPPSALDDDDLPGLDLAPSNLPKDLPAGLDGAGLFVPDLKTTALPPKTALPLPVTPSEPKPAGKLKLQKVHRLFAWVHQGCGKYGHEHMAIMIDAYKTMGYITDDAAGQIHEIMRMVPQTRRDVADIGPNEFVSELYILNRILDPEDATMDRDLIEVLMLARRRQGEQPPPSKDAGDTWIELLDRI